MNTDGPHRTDGFATVSGCLAVAVGPVLLLRGAPAGWTFLLIAAGLVLLSAQWIITNDIELDVTDRVQLLVALAGAAFVAIAVVYLTRAANDLPSLFPGHDGDSETFCIVPGIVSLTVGLAMLGRGVAAAHPVRA